MGKLYIESRFGQTPNKLLNNEEISMKAKGLYGFMQSKPDGRNFSANRIALQSVEGETSIKNGLKELENNGYLIRKKSVKDGKFIGIDYTLTVSGLSTGGLSTGGKPPNISKKDTSKKEIDYITELEDLIKKRNSIVLVSKIKQFKQLPKIRKVNNKLKSIYNTKRKEYTTEEIKIGLNNYLEDIKERKYTEGNDYYNHRFTLYIFLKQENGLDKFINI